MRLQLTSAFVVAALLRTATANAEEPPAGLASVDLRSSVYQDTDRTFISTSAASARADVIEDRLSLNARYLVDVVSSASVDVVTSATKTRFHDLRHEVRGGAGYRDDKNSVSGSYTYSTENDWWSHTASLGGTRDIADRRVTLGLVLSATHNDIGRRGDPVFRRELDQGAATLEATFVATRRDLVSVGYTLVYLTGFQSSPYRFVFYGDPSVGADRLSVRENLPPTRTRHAVGLRWNRHVFADSAVRTHARAYTDDWGIASFTGGVEYVVGLGRAELGPFVRGYVQKAADFYRDVYTAPRRYMSFDKETATFVDAFAGLRFGWWHPIGRAALRFEAKASGNYFYYFDFPRLPERSGLVGDIAVGLTL